MRCYSEALVWPGVKHEIVSNRKHDDPVHWDAPMQRCVVNGNKEVPYLRLKRGNFTFRICVKLAELLQYPTMVESTWKYFGKGTFDFRCFYVIPHSPNSRMLQKLFPDKIGCSVRMYVYVYTPKTKNTHVENVPTIVEKSETLTQSDTEIQSYEQWKTWHFSRMTSHCLRNICWYQPPTARLP